MADQQPDHRDPLQDGSSCSIGVGGPDTSCVNPGYAAPAQPELTDADVKSPIRVKPFRTGRKSPGRGIGTATSRDIKAGERVVFKFGYLGGHGRYHGEVTYQRVPGESAIAAPRADGLRVGLVSFRLPRWRRMTGCPRGA